MKTFHSYSDVLSCIGQEVAISNWVTITQAQIQKFADATGDQQWIHTDPERAAKGPFGAPIAHGFLTLSLLPQFFDDTFTIEGSKMGVNYGLNRVRFLKPVPVGARVRALFAVKEAADAAQGGVQVTWRVSMQVEQADAPMLVCAAEFITLHYF